MTVSELRSDLRQSRQQLFDALRGLGEEQFRHTPGDEAWSIAAHLWHLLRVERLFSARAAAALTEDEPPIASTRAANDDDPGLAQRLAVPQVIHGLQATRRELDGLLARCSNRDLERAIVHERIGRMTIAGIAAKMAEHESEHAALIAGLARQAPVQGRVIIPLTRRS